VVTGKSAFFTIVVPSRLVLVATISTHLAAVRLSRSRPLSGMTSRAHPTADIKAAVFRVFHKGDAAGRPGVNERKLHNLI